MFGGVVKRLKKYFRILRRDTDNIKDEVNIYNLSYEKFSLDHYNKFIKSLLFEESELAVIDDFIRSLVDPVKYLKEQIDFKKYFMTFIRLNEFTEDRFKNMDFLGLYEKFSKCLNLLREMEILKPNHTIFFVTYFYLLPFNYRKVKFKYPPQNKMLEMESVDLSISRKNVYFGSNFYQSCYQMDVSGFISKVLYIRFETNNDKNNHSVEGETLVLFYFNDQFSYKIRGGTYGRFGVKKFEIFYLQHEDGDIIGRMFIKVNDVVDENLIIYKHHFKIVEFHVLFKNINVDNCILDINKVS